MELATYCLARCIESFGLCLVEWGLVSPRLVPPRMDVAFFSLAAACIMHCYSDSNGRHRDVFRSKYLNVLDFIFGNSGAISISHYLNSATPCTTQLAALTIPSSVVLACATPRCQEL